MSLDSAVAKVVVTGPFAAGKTTFVASAADSGFVGSERSVSDSTSALKADTTVALDHSVAHVSVAGLRQKVSLFGTPGQERFNFMWPVLGRGMHAYVIVVDGGRLQAQAQARRIVRAFAEIAPDAPFVVAPNRLGPAAVGAGELAEFLGVPGDTIVPCDPRDREEVRALLGNLLELSSVVDSRRAS